MRVSQILATALLSFATCLTAFGSNGIGEKLSCAAPFEIGNLPTVSYFHLRRFQNDPKTTLFLGSG
jgi:hypothetical protein